MRIKKINKYVAYFKLSLIIHSRHKNEVFWSIIVNFFTIILTVSLWKGIYSSKEILNGFTLNGILNYFLLTRLIITFTSNSVDKTLERSIKRGGIVQSLIKPTSIYFENLYLVYGKCLWEIFFNWIPMIFVSLFLFKINLNIEFYSLIKFIFALNLALFINYNLAFIVGITSIWTSSSDGIRHLKQFFIMIAGGALIPLSFFPRSFQNFLEFLPFKYLIHYPISLILKQDGFVTNKFDLLILIFWSILLLVISLLLEKKSLKQITIYGG